MANNRLFIIDGKTGERVMLAKTHGGGWYLSVTKKELGEWMTSHDERACIGNCFDEPTNLRLEVEG